MAKDRDDTAIYAAFDEVDPPDSARPERNLLRAVLVAALGDLQRSGEASRKAAEYLMNLDEDYVFSFRSICNFLQIDPQRVLQIAGLMGRFSQRQRVLADQIGESDEKSRE